MANGPSSSQSGFDSLYSTYLNNNFSQRYLLAYVTAREFVTNIKQFFVNNEDPLVSSHKRCIKGGRMRIEQSFLVGLAETLPLPFFFFVQGR